MRDKGVGYEARWGAYTKDIAIKLEPRSVTFDAGRGSPVPEVQCVNNGDKIAKPDDPAAEGYIFGGWFKDPECTDESEWDFANDVVTEDPKIPVAGCGDGMVYYYMCVNDM